jgi:hypothetical protein
MITRRSGGTRRWVHRSIFALLLAGTVRSSAGGYVAPRYAKVGLIFDYDVVVFSATPGGVAAAVASARAGVATALLEPSTLVGGMCASGLSFSDVNNATTLGGFAREFFTRNGGGTFEPLLEPHAAEALFRALLIEAHVDVLDGVGNLVRAESAGGEGAIAALHFADGSSVSARVFVDASYNGDLAAAANCTLVAGREPASRYNESRAGRLPDGFPFSTFLPIDPFVGSENNSLVRGMTLSPLSLAGAGAGPVLRSTRLHQDLQLTRELI